jgi:hypothetical protein
MNSEQAKKLLAKLWKEGNSMQHVKVHGVSRAIALEGKMIGLGLAPSQMREYEHWYVPCDGSTRYGWVKYRANPGSSKKPPMSLLDK